MHDLQLRDNPPSGRPIDTVTRPFDMQEHVFNQSHPDIVGFLERIRRLIDQYPGRFTVAEVGGQDPIDEMRAFTAHDRRLNSAYNFDFLYAPELTPDLVRKSLAHWSGAPGEGWPSWAFSNHDAPRSVSRWAKPQHQPALSQTALMLLLSLRGNAFIYQGEELALPQAEIAFADLKDPEAIANWPRILGRDGARTPMPWRADQPHAGFSTHKPWLPVDPRHHALSVDQQSADQRSMLWFTRNALSARRALPALHTGDFQIIYSDAAVLAFVRATQSEKTLCVFNLSTAPAPCRLPGQSSWRLAFTSDEAARSSKVLPDVLSPLSAYWATE
jgi:alpha-glucosidase